MDSDCQVGCEVHLKSSRNTSGRTKQNMNRSADVGRLHTNPKSRWVLWVQKIHVAKTWSQEIVNVQEFAENDHDRQSLIFSCFHTVFMTVNILTARVAWAVSSHHDAMTSHQTLPILAYKVVHRGWEKRAQWKLMGSVAL